MTWLLRSMAQSLSARHARNAWPARDHLRAGQAYGLCDLIEIEMHEIGEEQEQSPAAGGKTPGSEREGTRIGYRLHGGAGDLGALLVEPAGKRHKAELAQHSRTAVALSGVPRSLSASAIS
ncbi:MAG: hypothetical protein ACRED0_10030 [Gammaproteobacteria bacterium]